MLEIKEHHFVDLMLALIYLENENQLSQHPQSEMHFRTGRLELCDLHH